MTPEQDIERVLKRWFAEGPSEVPDRVFDATVDRVYRQPQRRVWRLPVTGTHMITPARLAAAVAAFLLVVAGVAWFGSPSNQIAAPTTSASATPSASPSASPGLPAASPFPCWDGPCLGALAPGTYRTKDVLVPFSYRVPAGWENPADIPGNYVLEQQQRAAASDGIFVWPDPVAAALDPCAGIPEPGVGRTVTALVAWLTAHPGLTTTAPQAVTLGGLTGQVLDVRKKTDWSGKCASLVSLFVHDGSVQDPLWWQINDNARMRLWLLDAGNGHVLGINAEAHDPSSPGTFLAAATPIVESFEFTPSP